MKKSNIIFITLIILFLCAFTANVVFNALTGTKLVDVKLPSDLSVESGDVIDTSTCSPKEKLTRLDKTDDVNIRKLSRYQEVCDSYVTDKLMIFANIPKDSAVAAENAEKMAKKLKEFSIFGITPIVIVEPETDWGLIDFEEYSTGFYDDFVSTYFEVLKDEGITDEQMGMWVAFPEANLPLWNHASATPDDYSNIVNKYYTILKDQFPGAHTSILLSSSTYENDDFDWTNGEYVSLRDYVIGLDKDLIDSFGMQGFPWLPTMNDSDQAGVLNADEFLSTSIAIEAAEILGVDTIWLNTGTFGAKYTLDMESVRYVKPEIRLDVLNGVLSQAIDLRDKGYMVTINIFAEDKSGTAEATDWSYLRDSYSGSVSSEIVFKTLLSKVEKEYNIFVSLFDK